MSFGGRGAPQQGGYDDMAQMASMHMMMGIMKSCFTDCISNFAVSDLSSSEKTCLQNCSKRMAGSYEVVSQAQQTLAARGGQLGAF
jgi:hypothetical protein